MNNKLIESRTSFDENSLIQNLASYLKSDIFQKNTKGIQNLNYYL